MDKNIGMKIEETEFTEKEKGIMKGGIVTFVLGFDKFTYKEMMALRDKFLQRINLFEKELEDYTQGKSESHQKPDMPKEYVFYQEYLHHIFLVMMNKCQKEFNIPPLDAR